MRGFRNDKSGVRGRERDKGYWSLSAPARWRYLSRATRSRKTRHVLHSYGNKEKKVHICHSPFCWYSGRFSAFSSHRTWIKARRRDRTRERLQRNVKYLRWAHRGGSNEQATHSSRHIAEYAVLASSPPPLPLETWRPDGDCSAESRSASRRPIGIGISRSNFSGLARLRKENRASSRDPRRRH